MSSRDFAALSSDNKNSKEQEATGSLQKRVHHGSEQLPPHKHPVRWAGFLSLAPLRSPFPEFSEELPIPVVMAL